MMHESGSMTDPVLRDRSLSASEVHLAEARVRQLTCPSVAPFVTDALAGAIAGTVAGGLAGPLGALIGAIVGGAMGFGTGAALEVRQEIARVHDERLDRDIGVIGGDVGAGPGGGFERALGDVLDRSNPRANDRGAGSNKGTRLDR
jgi:hypothetical protein